MSCTTIASANHINRNQVTAVPPCPLSITLIVVSSRARLLATPLSDHHRCRCATLVAPPPLVCRPLRFAASLSRRLHLLSRYCAPLVQLVVVLPGGLPPPLRRRLPLSSLLSIRWLSFRVASHCLVPWPPLPLSSCLCLLLGPSRLVGCRVVLPGAPASIPLSSRLRPARWPLITQPPLIVPSRPPVGPTADYMCDEKRCCLN
jgi:hypothetical protein